MQLMVAKEIREADRKIDPWLLYSEDKGFYLKEDAPEKIRKLKKKSDEWHSKHHSTMN